MSGLSPSQQERFKRDGFLVIEDFASAEQCLALKARAEAIVEAFEPPAKASIFETAEDQASEDRYFMESGGAVRCFLEAEAFDAAGKAVAPKSLSINKIGHALHDRDPLFERFSRRDSIAAIARDLGLAKPLLAQSMYIFKQPRIGGEVVCHQDSTFLFTEPLSVVGLWFAIEDSTIENGCLWALPGGHHDGLKRRFARIDGGGKAAMTELDPTPWPVFASAAPYVPLAVPRGALVLLDGLLPHLSGANRSDRSRHAYTLHLIDGAADYPADNWLKRDADDPMRGF